MKNIILLFVLLISGCGGSDNSGGNPVTRFDPQEFPDINEIVSLIEMESDIPEDVGQIVSFTEDEETGRDSIGTCTGNLIDKNIIITNRHCIHSAFINDPVRCAGQFRIVFQNNGTKQTLRCQKVLAVSPSINKDQGDYAIIELNQSVRATPLRVSKKGVDENTNITVNSVNLFEDEINRRLVSRLRVSKCKSVFNTVFDYYSRKSMNITLIGRNSRNNCDIISGNSGSAMINDRTGEAIGVVQAILELPEGLTESSAKSVNDKFYIALLGKVKKLVAATNFYRVPYFNSGLTLFDNNDEEAARDYFDWKEEKRVLENNFFPDLAYRSALNLFRFHSEESNTFLESLIVQEQADITMKPKCILRWLGVNDLPETIMIGKSALRQAKLYFDQSFKIKVTSTFNPYIFDETTSVLKTDHKGPYYEYYFYDNLSSRTKKLRRCEIQQD